MMHASRLFDGYKTSKWQVKQDCVGVLMIDCQYVFL